MRLSLSFSGFGPLAGSVEAVQAAEDVGLDGVWTAEHVGFHDAIVPSAMFLQATKRLEIGMVGFSAATRHPGALAMELASLCEVGGADRIRIQVGVGDPDLVAQLGGTVEKPVLRTRQYVDVLREMLSGKSVNRNVLPGAFKNFKLNAYTGPPPKIDVMAIRPGMQKLAAQCADGVSLSVAASRTYLRETVENVERELKEAGRDRSEFRITALCFGFIAPGIDDILAGMGPMIATFPPEPMEILGKGALDGAEYVRVHRSGRTLDAAKMLTADVMRELTFACEPDAVGETIQSFADTGIDELGIMPMGPPEMLVDTIKLLAASRPA
jgi:alkanesulfonate monooxygenase SsuD/methylene tetrahydromethanopterin reductase-like flavin-dependent oxidoreductase (luciferase family)